MLWTKVDVCKLKSIGAEKSDSENYLQLLHALYYCPSHIISYNIYKLSALGSPILGTPVSSSSNSSSSRTEPSPVWSLQLFVTLHIFSQGLGLLCVEITASLGPSCTMELKVATCAIPMNCGKKGHALSKTVPKELKGILSCWVTTCYDNGFLLGHVAVGSAWLRRSIFTFSWHVMPSIRTTNTYGERICRQRPWPNCEQGSTLG